MNRVHKPYLTDDKNGENWYPCLKKLYPLGPNTPSVCSPYKGVHTSRFRVYFMSRFFSRKVAGCCFHVLTFHVFYWGVVGLALKLITRRKSGLLFECLHIVDKKLLSCLQVELSDLKKKTLQMEELARGSPSAELARSLNELGVLYFLQNNYEWVLHTTLFSVWGRRSKMFASLYTNIP